MFGRVVRNCTEIIILTRSLQHVLPAYSVSLNQFYTSGLLNYYIILLKLWPDCILICISGHSVKQRCGRSSQYATDVLAATLTGQTCRCGCTFVPTDVRKSRTSYSIIALDVCARCRNVIPDVIFVRFTKCTKQ